MRRSSALLLGVVLGCDGPGLLTPAELRWRWRYGSLLDVQPADDGVDVVVACPLEHGPGVIARFHIETREVRELERRDPLQRRDTLQFIGWRRCQDAAAPRP